MAIKSKRIFSRIGHRTASPTATMDIVGQSETFIEFQEALSRVAVVNRPVLLLGERGVGKELAATRLHFLSQRWQGPLISLNCAALTPSLIEAELFGHEKGAFTGAIQQRIGRFEAANGGSLFLDEIGAIPMEVQEKILRVVEYGSFERVGGIHPIDVDVRIVGATNADLVRLTREGKFKKDLLDRLSFEVLFLPPLRERKGDILLLANHFASRMAYELGRKETPEFSEEAAEILEQHKWSGNIRELKNVVERAVYRADANRIETIVIDPFQSPYTPESDHPYTEKPPEPHPPHPATLDDFTNQPLKSAVQQLERHMLQTSLKKASYNQKRAARMLGLSYDQFRGLRRKYADQIT